MSEPLPLFVHSKVDEAGLRPSRFRVLAHLRRRGDNDTGRCDPSIPEIARVCRMAEKTVKPAIKELRSLGVIGVEERKGRPNAYTINWGYFDTRASNGPHPKDTPSSPAQKIPAHRAPKIPPEGNPSKVIHTRIPEGLSAPVFHSAWEEWHAYRRERKLRPWTASTQTAKLAELAALGEAGAVAAIRASIANGWQSIYPAKGNTTKPTKPLFR